MKNRKGSYKKILLAPEFIDGHHAYLKENIDIILKNEGLNGVKQVTLYLLLFLRIKHQSNWAQKKIQIARRHELHNDSLLLNLIPTEFMLTEKEKRQLDGIYLEDFFLSFNLKGIPQAINRSLHAWANGLINLEVCYHIPSVRSLLKMQANGTRCVTLITSPDELNSLILNARDPLSFVIHDLAHADQFFGKMDLISAQIGFFHAMDKAYKLKSVKILLNENKAFKKDFEYAAADMNGHVLFLFKFLKSAYKRLNEWPEFKSFYELIEFWQMNDDEFLSAKKLNGPEFSSNDEKNLIHFFENKDIIKNEDTKHHLPAF